MQGLIVINKPEWFTSMDCCAIVRRAYGEKRVGHTGTLDPNATGVLPICIGKATRLIEYMDLGSKTYVAGFKLGLTSDTEDIWGTLSEEKDVNISKEVLEENFVSFLGDIDQIPPMYSAKKVNGEKLYDIARSGRTIERKANKIHIYSIKLLDFNGKEGTLEIECSRGTYIRTIIADLGAKLGTGAIMTSLIRTKASGFSIDDAVDLIEIKEGKTFELLPIETAVKNLPKIDVDSVVANLVLNGNPKAMEKIKANGGLEAVFCENKLIAIIKDGKIAKVFPDNR